MAPVMLSAQMAKADATRAKPVLGMPPGFELFRDSFDVLVRDESPLWAECTAAPQREGAMPAAGANVRFVPIAASGHGDEYSPTENDCSVRKGGERTFLEQRAEVC